MTFAYLFERFPSFGQTFCYREVAELARQGSAPPIFSIRKPKDEPPKDWDERIVESVHYLPEEEDLLREVRRASKKGKLAGEIIAALDEWGRRPDFLRLYQAVDAGSTNSSQSLSALPRMPTTFSRREIFKLVWTSLFMQLA